MKKIPVHILGFIIIIIFINITQPNLYCQKISFHDECKPGKNGNSVPILGQDDRVNKIKEAIREIRRSAKNCLPKNHYDRLTNYFDKIKLTVFFSCNEHYRKCADTEHDRPTGINFIVFNNNTVFSKARCGCLKSIVLHELLHWANIYGNSDADEIKAYSCSLKCYGKENCVVIPPEYNGMPNEKRCCPEPFNPQWIQEY